MGRGGVSWEIGTLFWCLRSKEVSAAMEVRERARGIPRPARRGKLVGQLDTNVDGKDTGTNVMVAGIDDSVGEEVKFVIVVIGGDARSVALFRATVLELSSQQDPFCPLTLQQEKLLQGITIAISLDTAVASHQFSPKQKFVCWEFTFKTVTRATHC